MSRRRIEQGTASAGSFSLRALSSPAAGEPPVPAAGLAVPGVGFIGGALSITARMLRPVATADEVQQKINHMQTLLSKETDGDVKKLIKENIEKLEDNLLNPPAEVREDMQEVRLETLEVLKKNKELYFYIHFLDF